MKNTKKLKIALWSAVALKLGFAFYTVGAFANPSGFLEYDYDPVTIEEFAEWSKLSIAEAKAKAEAVLIYCKKVP